MAIKYADIFHSKCTKKPKNILNGHKIYQNCPLEGIPIYVYLNLDPNISGNPGYNYGTVIDLMDLDVFKHIFLKLAGLPTTKTA
jgi:hypothetical protein